MTKKFLKYPLMTEKSSTVQANFNQYTFRVDTKSTRLQIKQEVEALKKGIVVESIQTLVVRGKVKRVGHSSGKRSNYKKAVVRLAAGQTLELFEGASAT